MSPRHCPAKGHNPFLHQVGQAVQPGHAKVSQGMSSIPCSKDRHPRAVAEYGWVMRVCSSAALRALELRLRWSGVRQPLPLPKSMHKVLTTSQVSGACGPFTRRNSHALSRDAQTHRCMLGKAGGPLRASVCQVVCSEPHLGSPWALPACLTPPSTPIPTPDHPTCDQVGPRELRKCVCSA
jgi:hypothetical protein